MKYDKEHYQQLYDEAVHQHQLMVQSIDHDRILDDEGYPTEYCLGLIKEWHWSDSKGWFDFIKSVWYMANWGWKELEEVDEIFNKKVQRYYLSTAGWSGNEAIIKAMEQNNWTWYMNWVQSRRGGHYIFQLKEFEDD